MGRARRSVEARRSVGRDGVLVVVTLFSVVMLLPLLLVVVVVCGPPHGQVYMKFADGKESGGNYEEAIKFFEKALDVGAGSCMQPPLHTVPRQTPRCLPQAHHPCPSP